MRLEDPAVDLVDTVIDMAHMRGVYGEARYVAMTSEDITASYGAPVSWVVVDSEGLGIRLRGIGGWGFAATDDLSRDGVEKMFRKAFELVASSPGTGRSNSAPRSASDPEHYVFESTTRISPWDVPVDEKIALLEEATRTMASVPRVIAAKSSYRHVRERRLFASTDGITADQSLTYCGGGIEAWSSDGEMLQQRSYPSREGDVRQAGYEYFAELDLAAEALRVADEAVALLRAPECPSGEMTVVLGGEQVGLQLHESVGHALELDRILGSEAAYAGTSFVEIRDRGRLRYGSTAMNVTTDPTAAGGVGTCAADDEGSPTRRAPLVVEGKLCDFLSSRETAAACDLPAGTSAMRADGWARQPLVRMSNLCLEPGDGGGLEQLVGEVDDGLYLDTNRSLSIDDRRLDFQFSTEVGWEIHHGHLGRLLRDPVYFGRTPVFWRGLESVGTAEAWRLWSVANCGKGEPAQLVRVSHGASPARFHGVGVGASR